MLGLYALTGAAASPPVGIHDPNAAPSSAAKAKQRAGGDDMRTQANGVTVLTFEGLGNLEPAGEFYNGGAGGDGSGPGPALGITFSPNSLAIIDSDAGGSGNFGGEPSPDTVLFFQQGTAATINVAGGVANGFSFFYSAISQPAQIVVYDGPDASA